MGRSEAHSLTVSLMIPGDTRVADPGALRAADQSCRGGAGAGTSMHTSRGAVSKLQTVKINFPLQISFKGKDGAGWGISYRLEGA